MEEEALAEAKEFFALLGDCQVAGILARGDTGIGYNGVMKLAAEALARRAKQAYVPALRIARLYAHAGEKALALQWLEQGYEQREPPLVHLRVAWDWDALRDSPRFQSLLRRMSLPA